MYPSLVKIDVEGHEWAVICGAKRVISSHKPTLIIEILPSCHKEAVCEYLLSLGYKAFRLAKDHLVPMSTVHDLMRCREWDFVFCADSVLLHKLAET
jgi:hypothetical protein